MQKWTRIGREQLFHRIEGSGFALIHFLCLAEFVMTPSSSRRRSRAAPKTDGNV